MHDTFFSDGKSIRIEAHEPASTAGSELPAVVLLHGAGGNVGFWLDRIAPHLLSTGVALYAPHYFDRTCTNYPELATIADGIHFPQWLDTIGAALHWVANRPGTDAHRIALIGISLGGFLALSFAARNSASFDEPVRNAVRCIVDLSGGLTEPYLHFATSNFPPTLILHGEADTVVPVFYAHDLASLLTQLKVPHETRILSGEGHWFSSAAQLQMLLSVSSFLSQHLKPTA